MQCLWRPEERIKSSGAGVTDGCGQPRRCWEQNPGPLEEQWSQPLSHLNNPSLVLLIVKNCDQQKYFGQACNINESMGLANGCA